jgi:uncharacterized damage-inducible protein DinB
VNTDGSSLASDADRPFDLAETLQLLGRTPAVFRSLVAGLPEHWLTADEGTGTWSPRDVIGHLVHGERTDWIVRARLILEHGDRRAFEPFDRAGHERWWDGWSMDDLLDEMERLRDESLEVLRALHITEETLDRRGRHPELGPVTLRQLLASWVVHDLHHLGQIARVMARRYGDETGPWSAYLSILTR